MTINGFLQIDQLQRHYWAEHPDERAAYEAQTREFWKWKRRGNLNRSIDARAKAREMYAKSEAWVAQQMEGYAP